MHLISQLEEIRSSLPLLLAQTIRYLLMRLLSARHQPLLHSADVNYRICVSQLINPVNKHLFRNCGIFQLWLQPIGPILTCINIHRPLFCAGGPSCILVWLLVLFLVPLSPWFWFMIPFGFGVASLDKLSNRASVFSGCCDVSSSVWSSIVPFSSVSGISLI